MEGSKGSLPVERAVSIAAMTLIMVIGLFACAVLAGSKPPATRADAVVDTLHARKMAALLQAKTGGDAPILLLYDTKAGHSGGMPASKVIEDETDELGFLFWQLGVK
jgi:hypothetical protein